MKNLLVVILAFLGASPTLYLLETSLKYIFYLFQVALILLVYASVKSNFKVKIVFGINKKILNKLDFVFPIISTALLVLNLIGLNGIASMTCAIIVCFFLPGYVLLKVLGFRALKSWMEWLVLSFMLSIGLTSLIFTVALPFKAYRKMLVLILYLTISSVLLIKEVISDSRGKQQNYGNQVYECNLCDFLLLLWVLLFFVFIISSLFPQTAYRPGTDIVRHFLSSRLLLLAPETYSSYYPWFHMSWAMVYELSSPTMEIFQTGLAYLSLMVILSFYVMTKVYFKDDETHVPILATIFFSTFSGFGWLYFLREKLFNPNPSEQLRILLNACHASYWDILFGQGFLLWHFFNPITTGFTGLFTLLYLLRRIDLKKTQFFLLCYFSTITLSLTHVSELVFCVMLILILCVFPFPSIKTRLKDFLVALLSALVSLLGLKILYDLIGLTVLISTYVISMLILASAFSFLIIMLKERFSERVLPFHKVKKPLYVLTLAILVLWLGMLLYWVMNPSVFHTSMVSSVFGVPWIMYPVLLGICGLATFPAILHIIEQYSSRNQMMVIFVLIFFVSIAFGRLLTYINLHWFHTNYWERRFIPFAFFASAIISSKLISDFIKKLCPRKIMCLILLSVIAFSGLTSTLLSVELWSLSNQKLILSSDEQRQITLLNQANPNAYLLYFSERSRVVAEYAPFAWIIIRFRNHLWPATSPELVLNTLFSTGHPALIYLTKRDFQQLSSETYSQSYILSHLINSTPPLFDEAGAVIYSFNIISPPSENSDIVLVLSKNALTDRALFAYDILSQAGYNYTTSRTLDLQTLSQAETVVVPSEKSAAQVLKLRKELKLNFTRLIILNLDGYYGKLAKIDYPLVETSIVSHKYCEAYLEDPLSNENVTSVYGATLIPLVIKVKPHDNAMILADDKAAGLWKGEALHEGAGNLGALTLSNDKDLKISGEDSLKIEVGDGNFSQWQIRYEFENAMNLSGYDFVTFYWYGRGDGTKHVVQFNSERGDFFWYEFSDKWSGWKKVVLPMHVSDGKHLLYDLSFSKVTRGTPSWQNIKSIEFRLSRANKNVKGIFHLDRFAFEKAPSVELKVAIRGPLNKLQLISSTEERYLIAQIWKNETLPVREYYLFDETPASEILGRVLGNITFSRYNSTYSEVLIKIRIPISLDGSGIVHVKFIINPSFMVIKTSTIEAGLDRIELPTNISVTPLMSRMDVISRYGNTQTFFAAKYSYQGVNIFYFNFFPIIEAIKSESKVLYNYLGSIIKQFLGDLTVYRFQKETITAGSTAVFRRAILRGNITIKFNSAIVNVEKNHDLSLYVDGEPVYLPANIAALCPVGFDNNSVNASYVEILPGQSFYVNVKMQNASLRLTGTPATMILFLNDGSILRFDGMEVILEARNLSASLRKPHITVNGDGVFIELYTYGDLYNRMKIQGGDCKIAGVFSFTGMYGDTYTVTKQFDYTGEVKLSEPLYRFNEFRAFVGSIPYILIAAIICIILNVKKILLDKNE